MFEKLENFRCKKKIIIIINKDKGFKTVGAIWRQ